MTADLYGFFTVWTLFGISFGALVLAALISIACSLRTLAQAVDLAADRLTSDGEPCEVRFASASRRPRGVARELAALRKGRMLPLRDDQ